MITPLWTERDNKLQRAFTFNDFSEAFGFISRVALLFEKFDHHAEVFNIYNRVVIAMNTHSAGGVVTDKDHQLARAINELL